MSSELLGAAYAALVILCSCQPCGREVLQVICSVESSGASLLDALFRCSKKGWVSSELPQIGE